MSTSTRTWQEARIALLIAEGHAAKDVAAMLDVTVFIGRPPANIFAKDGCWPSGRAGPPPMDRPEEKVGTDPNVPSHPSDAPGLRCPVALPEADGYPGDMARRHAILDDNQRLLEQRIAELGAQLPARLAGRVCAAMVIGSVAEGRAHDESDLDLLLVLNEGSPRRSDYEWWDREVAPHLNSDTRFAVQPVIVARGALATLEPNLRQALSRGLALWDPEHILP